MSSPNSMKILVNFSKMSQSKIHRNLVFETAHALKQRYPKISIYVDLQELPGDPIPPLIGGYRPDIIGRYAPTSLDVLIAEAKTNADIDNQHTLNQIGAFLNHLDTRLSGVGTFVLAVEGCIADHARMILALTYRRRISSRLHILVFDGLDFWILNPPGISQWHLC